MIRDSNWYERARAAAVDRLVIERRAVDTEWQAQVGELLETECEAIARANGWPAARLQNALDSIWVGFDAAKQEACGQNPPPDALSATLARRMTESAPSVTEAEAARESVADGLTALARHLYRRTA